MSSPLPAENAPSLTSQTMYGMVYITKGPACTPAPLSNLTPARTLLQLEHTHLLIGPYFERLYHALGDGIGFIIDIENPPYKLVRGTKARGVCLIPSNVSLKLYLKIDSHTESTWLRG